MGEGKDFDILNVLNILNIANILNILLDRWVRGRATRTTSSSVVATAVVRYLAKSSKIGIKSKKKATYVQLIKTIFNFNII